MPVRRTGAPVGWNPPAPPDRFVGRDDELDRLVAVVRAGDRLVTVTGLAGIGKTRVAIELAHRLARDHEPRWVDLSTARSADAVCAIVAGAFGVRLDDRSADGTDAVDRLGAALRRLGPALVVLDELDGLPDGASGTGLVRRLVEAAPEACIVCTRRSPLRVRGERRFALGPLRTDDGLALLADRAPDAVGDADDRAALVHALDAMPLAIELAAAWMRVLPVAEVRRRVDEQLASLVSDDTDRPDRHRSLVAALEASAALLSPEVLGILRALSVFRGGFRLDAALAVAGPGSPDALAALVDASLVRLDTGGRYALPSSVRAWLRPPEGPRDDVREAEVRHGAYYAGFGAPDALAALDAHGGPARWHALAAEVGNLEAALGRALERGDPDVAGAAALALSAVVRRSGPGASALAALEAASGLTASPAVRLALAATYRENGQCERSEAAIAELAGHPDPLVRGEALFQLGSTAWQMGRLAVAEDRLREARDALVGAGGHVARTLGALALVYAAAPQRRAEARDGYRQALAAARHAGDRVCEGAVLSNLALLDRQDGRIAEARAGFEAALVVHGELDHLRAVARTRCMLGSVLAEIGEIEQARALLVDALRGHREVGDRWFEAVALALLGQLDQADGRLYEAREKLEEARALHRALGNRYAEAAVIGNLGSVWLALDDRDEARRAWEEALDVARVHGDQAQVGAWLACLGRLDLGVDHARARAVIDEALEALRGGPLTELGVAWCVRAELEAADGDLDAARAAVGAAEALARLVGVGPRSPLGAALAAVRIRVEHGAAGGTPGAEPIDALEIAPDGGWFRLGQAAGDLSRRHAIRRVLCALADGRGASPGAPIDVEALFAAGWPGQRAVHEAARERVYNAVGTLRRLGLAPVLERVEGGWRLDPAVPLRR